MEKIKAPKVLNFNEFIEGLKPSKNFNLKENKKKLSVELKEYKINDIESIQRSISDLEYLLENIEKFNRNMVANDIKNDIELQILSHKKFIEKINIITKNVIDTFFEKILIDDSNEEILFFHYIAEKYSVPYITSEFRNYRRYRGKKTKEKIINIIHETDFLHKLLEQTIYMVYFIEKHNKDFFSKKATGEGSTKGKTHETIKKPLLNAFDTVIEYSELVENNVMTQHLKEFKKIADSFYFVSESRLLQKYYRELFKKVYKYLLTHDYCVKDKETDTISYSEDYRRNREIEKNTHDKAKKIISLYMELIYKKPLKINTITERESFGGFTYLSPHTKNDLFI